MRKFMNPVSIFLVVFSAAALYLWFLYQPAGQAERPQMAVPVAAEQVQLREYRDIIEALGTAKANESIVVTAQAQDVVTAIHFDDGDTVAANQLLLELDTREERARVEELEFRLEEAQRQAQRLRNLRSQNAASQQQLEAQEVVVKETLASLEVAQTQLAEKQIRAPFAGQLGIRDVSVGSLVSPGQQITTLDDLNPIKLDFNVPELQFASLQVGQQISATSGAYPGEVFTGMIRSIDSRIDPATRSILVRATINNDDQRIRPGMLLKVTLLRSVEQTMILPEQAIVPIEDRHYVYRVKADNTVEQVQVVTGRRKPGLVEIISGIEVGDTIVTDGIVRMRDGIAVNVREG
ncbi:efflux RND transporter periplasmic adaptor subunit [Pseudidiomarina taiwanensis]|uniref:Efflux transporter periplasmic adaptor subunit n=1 Tax=Pseudidiomarina taiwanensis TaxID=337250 RepID=A0A432ZHT0_9GAMM|nr:efflux RND transporter periplasmic adaptor subunit [Pseudidiomarina taiwanensis]RUO76832.1 efflux transporter periplasmic adaptor subunit [Pseudidiomarina taiwanensis]